MAVNNNWSSVKMGSCVEAVKFISRLENAAIVNHRLPMDCVVDDF